MCDIYAAKCAYPECLSEIWMHLGDYATRRDEVLVYCANHIPEMPKRKLAHKGTLWTYHYKEAFSLAGGGVPSDKYGDGRTAAFVVPLTDNAKDNWESNHPNCCYPIEIVPFVRAKS